MTSTSKALEIALDVSKQEADLNKINYESYEGVSAIAQLYSSLDYFADSEKHKKKTLRRFIKSRLLQSQCV